MFRSKGAIAARAERHRNYMTDYQNTRKAYRALQRAAERRHGLPEQLPDNEPRAWPDLYAIARGFAVEVFWDQIEPYPNDVIPFPGEPAT